MHMHAHLLPFVEHDDVEDGEVIELAVRAATTVAGPEAAPGRFYAAAFVRRRVSGIAGGSAWFEVLLQRRRRDNKWAFPQVRQESDEGAANAITASLRRAIPRAEFTAVLSAVSRGPSRCVTKGRTTLAVYYLRDDMDDRAFRGRGFGISVPPLAAWLAESELAYHAVVGPPKPWGAAVCEFALAQWCELPVGERFATAHPPLVLYHGTGLSAVTSIGFTGLKGGGTSAHAMLGPGVYLARWDKACDFAVHDNNNAPRNEPGVVVRVMVFAAPDECVTLTEHDTCSCGCARAFVDHVGVTRAVVVSVPDNAASATRRAEWCVKQSDRVAVCGFWKPVH